jgi:hypothetical protein
MRGRWIDGKEKTWAFVFRVIDIEGQGVVGRGLQQMRSMHVVCCMIDVIEDMVHLEDVMNYFLTAFTQKSIHTVEPVDMPGCFTTS